MRPEELFFNIEEAAQFASTHEAVGVHRETVAHFDVFFVTVRVHDEQDELPDSEIGPTIVTMIGGLLTCAFLWLAVIEMFRQALTH